jgi:hypothetical protein
MEGVIAEGGEDSGHARIQPICVPTEQLLENSL